LFYYFIVLQLLHSNFIVYLIQLKGVLCFRTYSAFFLLA